MQSLPPDNQADNQSSSRSNKFDWLANLADYLDQHTEEILVAWRKSVEKDPRMLAASQLGKEEFEDSISTSLHLLTTQLRSGQGFTQDGSADGNADSNWADKKEATLAHEHGFHRWQEGYDIQELMFEWGHLHLCILEVFNNYESQHPQVAREAMHHGRIALAQLMNGGFSQSVAEYHRLQQAEAKEIVHSLSEALDELVHWEKQRGEVLREAVHDLRGNLTAVQAATSILDSPSGSTLSNQSALHSMLHRSTQTLQSMLTELLDLARLEAGQEERELFPIDVALLLRELCEANQPLAQTKGLYLNWSGPDSLVVETDALKLRRIAQNLLLNAVKYTSHGGIEIQWTLNTTNQWVLTVQDSGPGLLALNQESEVLQALVESQPLSVKKSSSAKESGRSGEGVGLAIVKRLCTILDAQLEVESASGKGTTFRVSCPCNYTKS